jgi:hypothetical protein
VFALHLLRRSAVQSVLVTSALVVSAASLEAGQNGPAPANSAAGTAAAVAAAAPAPGQFENVSLFFGLDGSKQPQDLGINAHMGIRFSGNAGFAVAEKAGLGVQVGAAWNVSDAAVHVLDQIGGPSKRTQGFVTFGLFQRTARRLNWALGYDMLRQDYYDNFSLAQWRADVSYGVNNTSWVGVALAKAAKGDDGLMGETPVRLDPITQVHGYFSHVWPTGANTRLWAGVANGHNNVVWVFPDNSRKEKVAVYGADLHMPLSDRFAVTGQGNFVTPTATGTVDAYLGVVFYPGRGAMRTTQSRFAPMIPVANNPTFSVNLKR